MKLVLMERDDPISENAHIVTTDITEFNLGTNFVDLQLLEQLIIKTYEKAAGQPFPKRKLNQNLTTDEFRGKIAPKCIKVNDEISREIESQLIKNIEDIPPIPHDDKGSPHDDTSDDTSLGQALLGQALLDEIYGTNPYPETK